MVDVKIRSAEKHLPINWIFATPNDGLGPDWLRLLRASARRSSIIIIHNHTVSVTSASIHHHKNGRTDF